MALVPFFQRFQRFSLRTLFAAMVLIALPLGWKCRQVSAQRAAARAVKAARGWVTYDYQIRDGETDLAEPPGPKWLRQILGDDFFAQIEGANFRERPTGMKFDEAVSALARLGTIRRVTLERARDSTVKCVAAIRSLEILRIEGDFTDHGIQELGHLKLSELNLDSRNLQDDAFSAIAKMLTLVNLSVRGDFSDEGIAQIRLPHLKELSLGSDKITRRGLLELQRLKTLRALYATDHIPLEAGLNLKRLLPDCDIFIGMFEIHLIDGGALIGPHEC